MQLQQQQQQHHRHIGLHQHGDPCACLRPVIRVFGLLTSFAFLVLIIEIKWLINMFLQLQGSECRDVNYRRSNQSRCLACWIFASWLAGGWRPTPVYVAMAISLILYPHNLWLSQVAGIFLLLLGLFRLTTLLRFIPLAKLSCDESLLPHYDFEKVSNEDFTELRTEEDDKEQELRLDDDVC
ncbi:uncharacterized protein Dwil_GK20186 [Drosophila willistoni]|uniref:Uncharacterized protein n=1 Tax=Drosophila willistoni TaxID=7260 RepID=A0A0Q9WQW1_DROWI|nr:uncharacterized protein Dwil_GK20186 [Drosophila willistoni]